MLRIPNPHTTPPGKFRYTQPETGVTFEFGTWHEILLNVSNHRKAMGIADLTIGWNDRLEHDACIENPHWRCEDDAKPHSTETPIAVLGRQLWGELHAFTESYPENPTTDDESKARYWLSSWRQKVPQFGGCNCRAEWARLEANFPADYSSRQAFVNWGIIAHDAINRKLVKPIFRPDLFESANLGGF